MPDLGIFLSHFLGKDFSRPPRSPPLLRVCALSVHVLPWVWLFDGTLLIVLSPLSPFCGPESSRPYHRHPHAPDGDTTILQVLAQGAAVSLKANPRFERGPRTLLLHHLLLTAMSVWRHYLGLSYGLFSSFYQHLRPSCRTYSSNHMCEGSHFASVQIPPHQRAASDESLHCPGSWTPVHTRSTVACQPDVSFSGNKRLDTIVSGNPMFDTKRLISCSAQPSSVLLLHSDANLLRKHQDLAAAAIVYGDDVTDKRSLLGFNL
ncbi:hypothetical protein DFH06DRAFT_1138877 [Mycena polygramma]|nr:hypothetical protein DFH06DRAFT_1138877 [Mycena polygramma]